MISLTSMLQINDDCAVTRTTQLKTRALSDMQRRNSMVTHQHQHIGIAETYRFKR